MTDKSIPDLIAEAAEKNINVYDYVAKEIWGTANVTTRRLAKDMCFGILYGKTPPPAPPTEFKQEYMCEWIPPNCDEVREKFKKNFPGFKAEHSEYADCPFMDVPTPQYAEKRQPEDRMHRVGVKSYKIRVYSDGDATDYIVYALSSLDARCIAFVLDGGCEPRMTNWDAGHIELAISYTEVI